MSCFSPDYFQILGWIISTNIHWIFFLQSWQFLLRIQLRQPRRQRCRSVGGILAPPSTTWPSSPPTSTPSNSCSPSSRTPSSPSPPPPRGPWLPPHQTISSIPKCEKRIEADRRKIGQTKELLNAFSLSEITISQKILCAASDWNFRGTSNTNQTHFKKMWRQDKKTVVTKLPILKGSTITKIFQRRIFERECDENRETERLFPENYYSWRMTIPRELLFPDNYYSSRMTVPWWEKLMNAIPRTRLRLNNACQHIYAPRKVAINRKVSPTAGK